MFILDTEKMLSGILQRVANLEQHVIKLIVPIQNITKIFTDRNSLNDLTNLLFKLEGILKTPLQINDKFLKNVVKDIENQAEKIQSQSKILDIQQNMSEIKYIGKKLNTIEKSLIELSQNGINKQIQLEFRCDGYEMVKKPNNYEAQDVEMSQDDSIRKLLKTLSDRESKAIIHRLGLLGEEKKSYTKIGKIFGISLERSRQIYLKACVKLRHVSRRDLVKKTNHKEIMNVVFSDIRGED